MSMSSTEKITRRQAVQATGKALAGVASLNALSSLSSAAGLSNVAEAPPPQTTPADTNSTEKLRIATCQFPVSASPAENAKYIRDFMHEAAGEGAHLLHTSEGSLSGYAGCDFPTFEKYDWDGLRKETADLRALATDLKMWLVLGSSHFLDENTKPTNCLYLIDPEGKIVDRYDKCFCTEGDQKYYSAGNRLVTHDIRGVKVGLAICYDVCWPQLYIAYRKKGVTVMIHSFSNASRQRRELPGHTQHSRGAHPLRRQSHVGQLPTIHRSPIPIGDRLSPGRMPRSRSSWRSISRACWFTTFPTPYPRAGGITISSR